MTMRTKIMRATGKALSIMAMTTLTACGDSFVAKLDDNLVNVPGSSWSTDTKVEKLEQPTAIAATAKADNATQQKEWAGEIFTLFAMRLPNYANGSADWTKTNDRLSSCDGRAITFGTDGAVNFYPVVEQPTEDEGNSIIQSVNVQTATEKPEYSGANPEHRYNFYAVNIGNAEAQTIQYGKSTITQQLTASGTQEITVGCSYVNEKDVDSLLRITRKGNYSSSASFKLLATYRSDLCYSNVTGYRKLKPVIHLKGLTTHFNIQVRGRFDNDTPKDSLFRNIVITGIEICAPMNNTLTLANASWKTGKDFQSAIDNDEVLTPNGPATFFAVKTRSQTGLSEAQTLDRDNFYLPQIQAYMESNGQTYDPEVAAGWWHVNSLNYATIAKNVFIPRSDVYTIRINYYYVNRVIDDNHRFTNLLQAGAEIYNMNGEDSQVATYTLQIPGQKFLIGESYTVSIDAYSLERMGVSVTRQYNN